MGSLSEAYSSVHSNFQPTKRTTQRARVSTRSVSGPLHKRFSIQERSQKPHLSYCLARGKPKRSSRPETLSPCFSPVAAVFPIKPPWSRPS